MGLWIVASLLLLMMHAVAVQDDKLPPKEERELDYIAMPECRIPEGRMTRQQIEAKHDKEMLKQAKEIERLGK